MWTLYNWTGQKILENNDIEKLKFYIVLGGYNGHLKNSNGHIVATIISHANESDLIFTFTCGKIEVWNCYGQVTMYHV